MAATARVLAVGSLLALSASGCDLERGARAFAMSEVPVTHVVDSILPIEEELRRFRQILGPPRDGLEGGARSRDELVEKFESAVAAADTAALLGLLMTRDEFGWIYYPSTRFTAPPYELAPGLVWFQIENNSSQGLRRLLGRLGGAPLGMSGYECAPEPLVEGRNRIWERCAVHLVPPRGEAFELTLFGGILERDGTFKFISYGNGF